MPNWCESDLWIRGPKVFRDELRVFVSGDEDSPFDFGRIVPRPGIYDSFGSPPHGEREKSLSSIAQELHGYPDWYSWCGANWGTKWNASHPTVKVQRDSLKYTFSTAWAPPTPIIEALAKKYPELTIVHKFYEQGMQYQGRKVYRGGTLAETWEGEYKGSRGG